MSGRCLAEQLGAHRGAVELPTVGFLLSRMVLLLLGTRPRSSCPGASRRPPLPGKPVAGAALMLALAGVPTGPESADSSEVALALAGVPAPQELSWLVPNAGACAAGMTCSVCRAV